MEQIYNLALKKINKKFFICLGEKIVYTKPDFLTLPSKQAIHDLKKELSQTHSSMWIDKIVAFESKYNPRKDEK